MSIQCLYCVSRGTVALTSDCQVYVIDCQVYVIGSYIALHTTRLQCDYIVITKTHKYTY